MERLIELPARAGYRFEQVAEHFPIIDTLKGVEQNPRWHGEGDVFIHTRKVCDALVALPEWAALAAEEQGLLFLAALFHDIGKAKCTRVEDGMIVSPKHAITGARMFRELCYRDERCSAGLTWQQREQVAALIRFHGLPQMFMEKQPIERYLVRARETADFRLLWLLARADVLGRECADQQQLLAVTDYFREYALELGCFYDKIEFANAFTRNRYFRGANVGCREELFDTTEFTVYMMAGLPLSGKDRYIETFLSDYPVIALDQIREEWKLAPDKGSAAVAAEAKERARVLLRKKQPFVWNATNIIGDTRRKLYDLFEAYGARVVLIYIEQPYHVLLERNKVRERYIPAPVLEQMIRKLEVPEPMEAYQVIYHCSDREPA